MFSPIDFYTDFSSRNTEVCAIVVYPKLIFFKYMNPETGCRDKKTRFALKHFSINLVIIEVRP